MESSRIRLVALPLIVSATLVFSLPGAAAVKRSIVASRASAGCGLASPQPAEPLELNTISVSAGTKDYVKSVATETETFQCPAGNPSAIQDVETVIDLVKARSGISLLPLAQPFGKRVTQAICLKVNLKGTVSCKAQPLQLASATPNPLRDCKSLPPQQQPAAPVRMNTVVVGNQLVYTIKVEKEVWSCGADRLADAYLFTEISEIVLKQFYTTPSQRVFEGIVCFKSIAEARLLGCRLMAGQGLS